MPEKRRIPFSLEQFLKRSWPLLAVGAVFILGLAMILFRFALSHKSQAAPIEGPLVSTSSSQPTVRLVPRKLDGVAVIPEHAELQPYAVMVENAPDARPLTGVSQANIVIEAPVEGGITRFMLIYDATTTATAIGPVRSARPYFVDLANAVKAVYAHVGGSPEALTNIGSLSGFRDLNQFFNGHVFWRSARRVAPHNVYTRMDLLIQATQDKAWSTESFTGWHFLSTAASSTEHGDVTDIRVPYGGSFSVSWSYDSDTNEYIRFQAGAMQKDEDGGVVSSSNVLVMLTEAQVLDSAGRLRLRTTGKGRAVLFRNGERQEGTWKRTAGEWVAFETVEGGDLLFAPGKTWISIVTSPGMMPVGPSE